jgi:hypothetical protein
METEMSTNCQGRNMWVRTLKFGIRDNGGYGWNGFWDAENEDWYGVEPPLYDEFSGDDISAIWSITE